MKSLESYLRAIARPIAPALNELFGKLLIEAEHEKVSLLPYEGLRAEWEEIRDEFLAFKAQKECPRMTDALAGEKRIGGDEWRVAFLRFFSCEITENRRYFPKTAKLLGDYPEVMSAFFSVLPPGKRLTPHKGAYKGVLRYHLGLKIPDEGCGLKVEGETFHWKEGEWLVFDDTVLHEAWNESDEFRLILLLDVRRELKGLAKWFDRALTFGLSRIVFPMLGTYRKMIIP